MRTRSTLLAALTVVLTSSSLLRVYDGTGWLLPVVGGVAVVAAAGLLARRLRVPALLQPAVAVVLVAVYVALLDARTTLALGLLPTPGTARRLGTLFGQGLLDVDQRSAPVPTHVGLVLLAVLGVAAVAAAVDLLAVALRRPAPAGLPLLALLAVPSGTLQNGIGWLPFVLGASGWLLLLMDDASLRQSRWGVALRGTGPRRALDERSLGRTGRRIGVAALGLALVVPVLVPGLDQRVFASGGGNGLGGGSRSTVTYNPLTALAGQLRLPQPRTLVTYRTTDPAPDYLRLTTLDRFDDRTGWSASELSADVRRDAVRRGIPVPAAVQGATTQPVTATVRVDALGGPWLPVPAVPNAVDVTGAWLWDKHSETVFSTRTSVDRLADPYRVTSTRVVPDADVLRRDGTRPTDVAALATPPPVTPYVQQLTAQVTKGAPTAYDKVVALQAFFRTRANGFVYSEDTSVPGITSSNALEAFLRGRRGFCEQYASAMAAMVRVLGIPARVAVGFTPGARQSDGTYTVTTSDAHAWPEVWFPDGGWVRFEPTPRAEQVSVPAYSAPLAAGDGRSAAVPAPSAAAQPSQAPGTVTGGQDARKLQGDPSGGGPGTSSGHGAALPVAIGAAALALLVTPALLAGARRRRLWRDGGPRAAWAHVVEDAVDVGHRWWPAESPAVAADRLVVERHLEPEPAQALLRLAERVQLVRYGRPGSAPDVPAVELRRDVSAVRAGLLESAQVRTRWMARVLPRSPRWSRAKA